MGGGPVTRVPILRFSTQSHTSLEDGEGDVLCMRLLGEIRGLLLRVPAHHPIAGERARP